VCVKTVGWLSPPNSASNGPMVTPSLSITIGSCSMLRVILCIELVAYYEFPKIKGQRNELPAQIERRRAASIDVTATCGASIVFQCLMKVKPERSIVARSPQISDLSTKPSSDRQVQGSTTDSNQRRARATCQLPGSSFQILS